MSEPEAAGSLDISVSNFKTAEAHFKDTEEVLRTLKEQLEGCLERVIKLTGEEVPSLESSDEPIVDDNAAGNDDAEGTTADPKGKLEVDLERLAKITRKKSVHQDKPRDDEDVQPARP